MHWSQRDQALTCQGRGCHRRPDFLFFLDTFAVILEVDEDFHRNYVIECEIGRIGIIKDNLKVPIVLVRYHPESKRYSMLKWVLNYAFASAGHIAMNEFGIYIFYVGYPEQRVEELRRSEEQMLTMPFPSTSFSCM